MLNTSLCGRLSNFVSFMLAEKIGNCLKLPSLATFKVSTAIIKLDGMFKMQFEKFDNF